MKPAAFDYVRIDSAEEACALLAQRGEDARILAGGQSLMPILNMRLAQPAVLLDVSLCAELTYVRSADGMLSIGAAATQASVEWRAGLPKEVPLLAAALPHMSHFQVRNRGTVCGSLAHADPSAELPLCLLALDGQVVLRSQAGERIVPAAAFFLGLLTTARRNDELLMEVRYPLARPTTGYAFEEFAMRHGDYAVVAAAAVVDRQRVRLAIGGVADRPVLAQWPTADAATLQTAINDFAWALDAQDDAQASARMRRHLVRQLGTAVIARAHAAVEQEI